MYSVPLSLRSLPNLAKVGPVSSFQNSIVCAYEQLTSTPQIVSHPPLLISASSFRLMKLGMPWLRNVFLSIES